MITLYLKKGEQPVNFYTIGEMAGLCDRTKYSFHQYIAKGILPEANFRKKDKVINCGERSGTVIRGERLYSVDFLAPKLVAIFKKSKIRRGVTISNDIRLKFYQAFVEEKNFYLPTKS